MSRIANLNEFWHVLDKLVYSGGIGRRYLPWATLGYIRETIIEGELKIIGCHARCKSLPIDLRQGFLFVHNSLMLIKFILHPCLNIGLQPSGKAWDFDSQIRWFESNWPSGLYAEQVMLVSSINVWPYRTNGHFNLCHLQFINTQIR